MKKVLFWVKKGLFWLTYPLYIIVMIALGLPGIIGYYCEKLMNIIYDYYWDLEDKI